MNKNRGSPWQMVAVIGTMGMEVIFLSIGGAWLGRYLDEIFQSKPICLVIGIFWDCYFGFLSAALTLKKLMEEN